MIDPPPPNITETKLDDPIQKRPLGPYRQKKWLENREL